MCSKQVDIEPFLSGPGIVVDVRSPAEYSWARIPGAISLPLFTDEERKVVGICYKQEGQKQAEKTYQNLLTSIQHNPASALLVVLACGVLIGKIFK